MARRITPSQARSKLRQAQTKQRQGIQKLNNDIRQYNNEVRRINTKNKQAIDAYNREVRGHNSRVRANRARLQSDLQRLSQQNVSVRYRSLHVSVSQLTAAYELLDKSDADPFLSDRAERETANSVTLLNNLVEPGDSSLVTGEELANTRVGESLATISLDLSDRWVGAIFALNPKNPEATRHFCTSSREVISDIFRLRAPDADVLAWFPDCPVTERGTPTRRAKVRYWLDRKSEEDSALEDFIDTNIKDINFLFDELNSGTHGPAGKFSLPQLAAFKTRVEDCIEFMCELAL